MPDTKQPDTKQPKPKVQLLGADGNAFMIAGLCHRAARDAQWSDAQWNVVRDEMFSGDYDQVLLTAMTHFDVS